MKRRSIFGFLFIGLAGLSAEKVDFEKQVLPIFERSCYDCHGDPAKRNGKKAKGGLRMDSLAQIKAGGGEGDPAIVPGKPEESSIYEFISLEAGNDDIMPPAGKAQELSVDEIALIKRWIKEGADFGNWKGTDTKGPVAHSGYDSKSIYEPKASYLYEVASKLSPLPKKALRDAQAAKAFVRPITPGYTLYAVSFPGYSATTGDDVFKSLNGMVKHITALDLARTAVTDKGAGNLRYMENLTRLDLRNTPIGDKTVYYAATLKQLRYLNLYGTSVSDKGVQHLVGLKNLKELHLWETKVTQAKIDQLKQAMPNTEIVYGRLPKEVIQKEAKPVKRY